MLVAQLVNRSVYLFPTFGFSHRFNHDRSFATDSNDSRQTVNYPPLIISHLVATPEEMANLTQSVKLRLVSLLQSTSREQANVDSCSAHTLAIGTHINTPAIGMPTCTQRERHPTKSRRSAVYTHGTKTKQEHLDSAVHKRQSGLPEFETDGQGRVIITVGETYCRCSMTEARVTAWITKPDLLSDLLRSTS